MKPHQRLGFKTKKQAISTFSHILNSARLGEPIEEPLLCDLIMHRPRAADKVGTGISYIYAARASYNSRCFHVRRTDGTSEHFSYRKCLDGAPVS